MSYTKDWTGNLKKSLKLLFPTTPEHKFLSVEIGSFEGRGSIVIVDTLCKHSESRLYCIDPWLDTYLGTHNLFSVFDSVFKGQYDRFLENVKGKTNIIAMKGMSDDKIPELPSGIDFAYIDGDHSPEQVYKDSVNVFSKMKSGGIILFDDYGWSHKGIHTKDGINKFIKEYSSKVEVLFINYQAAVKVL